jgi:hypothetical protein
MAQFSGGGANKRAEGMIFLKQVRLARSRKGAQGIFSLFAYLLHESRSNPR